jgi:hypothetical protein
MLRVRHAIVCAPVDGRLSGGAGRQVAQSSACVAMQCERQRRLPDL